MLCGRRCVCASHRGAGVGVSPMPAQGDSPAARSRIAASDGNTAARHRRSHALLPMTADEPENHAAAAKLFP